MRVVVFALGLALACGREPPAAEPPRASAEPPRASAEPPRASAAPSRASAALVPFGEAWLLAQTGRYLDSPAARRRALERSLRSPENLYSRMRLGAYGLGSIGWDLLPEWNPRVLPATRATGEALAAGRGLAAVADAPPLWDGARPDTLAGWEALGRRVFFDYPLRPEVFAEHALARPEVGEAVGLRAAADGSVPGAVVFVDVDGEARVGITCALCHVAIEGGEVVVGRARRDFDYGGMRLAYHRDTGAPLEPDLARRMASWGPGRADITEDDDEDPVAIPDLWRLRELGALTQAATLRHAELGEDAPLALAIRQETQLLHANRERARPPRELAWALALFLYSLEPPPPAALDVASAGAVRGAALFQRHCEGCHGDPGGSGSPIAAEAVGTDPALARGTSRGTGLYRPAPLHRVADAAPYLHHGVVATLEDLFDPARLRADYRGGAHGPGPIAGHEFGVELPATERADLIAHLRTR
jgi:cytochrome c5